MHKLSCYNNIFRLDSGYILYNSLTGDLIKLSLYQYEMVDKIFRDVVSIGTSPDSELLSLFIETGFIVEDDVDEFGVAENKYLYTIASEEKLFLCIAPTMKCNLSCSYCFQKNTDKVGRMSEKVMRSLIDFVDQKMKSCDTLIVQWFGGEPLLEMDIISCLAFEFIHICKKYNKVYYSDIITNGILLNRLAVDTLSRMGVKAIQITLDGLPKTFSGRKHITLEKSDEFYRFVLDNTKYILDSIGSLIVRINVDRDNIREAEQVVKLFSDKNVIDERIDFRLGFLNTERGVVECIPHECLSMGEFNLEEERFRAFIKAKGYHVFGKPWAKEYPCTAVMKNAFTVDPLGRIGKCIPSIGTDQYVFSDLGADHTLLMNQTSADVYPFSDFNPYRDELCGKCPIIPLCMGSCPKKSRSERAYYCMNNSSFKHNLNDFE